MQNHIRWRIALLGTATLLASLLVGWPVGAHYRAKYKLAKYKQQLRERGEKMTIAELAPRPSPEVSDATGELMRAAGLLRPLSPNYTNLPPAMRYISPGKAMVAWQQPILPNMDSTNVWPELRQEMEANQDALAQLRAALEAPLIGFDLDYRQGAAMLLSHLSRFKGIAQWLSGATIFELHEGRVTNAWANLMALTGFVGRQRDEPVMISELVRVAVAAIAVNATWEALQSPDCTGSQLQALQSRWEAIDFLAQAAAALAMERVTAEDTYANARASYDFVSSWSPTGGSSSALSELAQMGKDVLDNPEEGLKAALHRYPGYWGWRWWQSYTDELANAEVNQVAIETVRRVQREKCWCPALKEMDAGIAAVKAKYPRAGQWLGFSAAEFTARFVTRLLTLEIQRSLLITAIEVKRFRLRHGTNPPNLAALTPEFASEIPRDIVDGKPLRYRLRPDKSFLLYSVGEDGEDNGGDPSPTPNMPKYWVRAKDAVWPVPANQEEINAALEPLTRKMQPGTPGAPQPASR